MCSASCAGVISVGDGRERTPSSFFGNEPYDGLIKHRVLLPHPVVHVTVPFPELVLKNWAAQKSVHTASLGLQDSNGGRKCSSRSRPSKTHRWWRLSRFCRLLFESQQAFIAYHVDPVDTVSLYKLADFARDVVVYLSAPVLISDIVVLVRKASG